MYSTYRIENGPRFGFNGSKLTVESDGVETIVNAAYRIFRRPVLLTDEHYRLIYQYPQQKLGSDIWDTLLDHRTLPLETIWQYQDAFLKDSPATYEPFYSDSGLTAEFPRIFGEVYTSDGRILGHIAIFMMEAPLGKHDLALAKIFVETLAIRMSSASWQETSSYSYLIDLLSEDTDPMLKARSGQLLDERLKGSYRLMVTPIGKNAAQKAYTTAITNRLTSIYRNTVSTIYRDSIVTLVGEMSESFPDKERGFLTNVTETLQRISSCTGISECFDDLSMLRRYYIQAYSAASMKHTGICFYEETAPDPMFLFLLETAPPETFLHPVLFRLLDYDKNHGSEYFETLRIFSLSMHDKDRSASLLHIHRNTLLYRLNRIRDLFDLPYEDPRIALHLLNSFQLYDVRERSEKAEEKPAE